MIVNPHFWHDWNCLSSIDCRLTQEHTLSPTYKSKPVAFDVAFGSACE